MKEMMAKAKAEKAEANAKKKEQEDAVKKVAASNEDENPAIELTQEEKQETKEYFDKIKEKYDQRYFEKQAGIKHEEEPKWDEGLAQQQNKDADLMGAEEYDRKLEE